MPSTAERLAQLPKAELHLHLEGAAEPHIIQRIHPGLSLREIQDHYRYSDFTGFLQSFKWVAKRLSLPEHYAVVANNLFATLRAQNVRYAEIMLSVGVLLWKEQDVDATFQAIDAEAVNAGFPVRWIFDAIRQFPVEDAKRVLQMAIRYRDRGVVAFGIGGNEELGPARNFHAVFQEAREAGLRLSVHGGETTGPGSVWEALEGGAERIGHGIRAVEDPLLLRHLSARQIPLEISVSSNLLTGAVASLEAHPLRILHEAGVPIILNTDDPALFRTSLTREYQIAHQHFGFSLDELHQIALNGFRFAFDADAASRALAAAGDALA
ncbi:MAG: adenosine deaminase [Bryobacterales bacterium]|jgi:adenosine deaminase/aminodeoxyfutalosine deaminase|nr:adenosine deaminase [Bryobacterales bacterium]